MHLEILQLPTTRLMLENSCFLMQGESITAWPLVCDPTSRVIDWLRKRMGKNLVEVKYSVSTIQTVLFMSLSGFTVRRRAVMSVKIAYTYTIYFIYSPLYLNNGWAPWLLSTCIEMSHI